jgi:hypothetical protein
MNLRTILFKISFCDFLSPIVGVLSIAAVNGAPSAMLPKNSIYLSRKLIFAPFDM